MRVRGSPSIDELTTALVSSVPSWVVALLRLRNALVRLIGLDPATAVTVDTATMALEAGGRVLFFRVYDVSDDTIVLGEDDDHLDYRLVVSIDRRGGTSVVTATTLVTYHGWRGRAYFAAVRPYHRLIMPAWLRSAARALDSGVTARPVIAS